VGNAAQWLPYVQCESKKLSAIEMVKTISTSRKIKAISLN